jgi:uncharacterized membrane protein (DUF373 family)
MINPRYQREERRRSTRLVVTAGLVAILSNVLVLATGLGIQKKEYIPYEMIGIYSLALGMVYQKRNLERLRSLQDFQVK